MCTKGIRNPVLINTIDRYPQSTFNQHSLNISVDSPSTLDSLVDLQFAASQLIFELVDIRQIIDWLLIECWPSVNQGINQDVNWVSINTWQWMPVARMVQEMFGRVQVLV